MQTNYVHGSHEHLDLIRSLWEELNTHHAVVSTSFSQDFQANTFEQRKDKLHKRYAGGQLRVDLAQAAGQPVGYLISGLSADGVGEIESIYIQAAYRSQAIGENLMQRALDWLDAEGAYTKVIEVAVGNERVYNFYARFGFYPRVTTLQQKEQA